MKAKARMGMLGAIGVVSLVAVLRVIAFERVTLENGDRVLSPRFGSWEVGDTVIVREPVGNTLVVVRAIATEGQTVSMQCDWLAIDGKDIAQTPARGADRFEEQLNGHTYEIWAPATRRGRVTAPASGARSTAPSRSMPVRSCVLADARARRSDSRTFGAITVDRVVGRAASRWWPLGHVPALDVPAPPDPDVRDRGIP